MALAAYRTSKLSACGINVADQIWSNYLCLFCGLVYARFCRKLPALSPMVSEKDFWLADCTALHFDLVGTAYDSNERRYQFSYP